MAEAGSGFEDARLAAGRFQQELGVCQALLKEAQAQQEQRRIEFTALIEQLSTAQTQVADSHAQLADTQSQLAAARDRQIELERQALSKLRRIMPNLEVHYVSATSIGLFEQTNAGYGEIWYELGGRRTMSRVTTEEGVLEAIYSLAGNDVPKSPGAPSESAEPVFRGHPLATPARGAGIFFYVLWPVVVIFGGILVKSRTTARAACAL